MQFENDVYSYQTEVGDIIYSNKFGCDVIVNLSQHSLNDDDEEQFLFKRYCYSYIFNIPVNGLVLYYIEESKDELTKKLENLVHKLFYEFLTKESSFLEFSNNEINLDFVESYLMRMEVFTTKNIKFEISRKEKAVYATIKRTETHKEDFKEIYKEKESVYTNYIK